MNRRNLIVVSIVAALLALPLLAAAQGESSSTEAAKPAPAATSAQPAAATHATEAKPASHSTTHHSTAAKIDLNSASREELIKLRASARRPRTRSSRPVLSSRRTSW
jgi:DNA uptake protein ComE-like DNA-binding protein